VLRNGPALYDAGGFGMVIDVGCLQLPVLALVTVAMGAFPAPLRWKLGGIAAALAVLSTLNVIRFMHLFRLGASDPTRFAFNHDVAWRVISLLGVILLWIGWRCGAQPEKGGAQAAKD
jgi:exosortase/archaeosortase family protein